MKHTSTGLRNALIVLLVIAAAGGCDLFSGGKMRTGSVSIIVRQDGGSRSILPDSELLEIDEYTLSGTGPESAVLEPMTNTTGIFHITTLVPGDWTIAAAASNAGGDTVAEGQVQITVESGETARGDIQLIPPGGTGSVDITVIWPGTMDIDEVRGTLTPTEGDDIPISFVVSGDSAVYEGDLEAGVYTLVVDPRYDGASAAPKRMEAVSVYGGLTSQGTINLGSTLPTFKVLNQWGIGGWENVDDGFIWMTGEAMKNVDLFATFQENPVDYEPEYLLTFKLAHPARADLIIVAYLSEAADEPISGDQPYLKYKYFTPYGLYATQEGTEDFPTERMVMDISEWAADMTSSRKIVLEVFDQTGLGTITNLNLEIFDGYGAEPVDIIPAEDALPMATLVSNSRFLDIPLTDLAGSAMRAARPAAVGKIASLFDIRRLTDKEFSDMKQRVGVRVPGLSYNKIIDGHGTGLAPPTEAGWKALRETMRTVELKADSKDRGLVPNEVNLMDDPSFPPVGNQGGLGSCVAFSNAYYARTFQEAKEQGWDLSGSVWEGGFGGGPSGDLSHFMSPAFLYNLINGGADGGAYYGDANLLLTEMGCSTWESMPYDGEDYLSWPDEASLREAPLYRAKRTDGSRGVDYALIVDSDDKLEILRQLIDEGIPVSISIDADLYGELSADDVWDVDNYVSPSTNHANTIVGYRQ